MTEKYLARVNYYCNDCDDFIQEGKWIIIESSSKIEVGITDYEFLPRHNCRKHYERQTCDDKICYLQEILEIKTFSEEEAKKLGLEAELEK
ncbi:hypothetical protein FJZ19_04770 [Candidatus Pacearchaeota archaeon]|nr:hypothetical protein [Candidatus Pacearchaeota archaeon]